ncbi:recombination protein NinB [Ralstonia mannitolilytica]|uniref:recombination protein NinB n=1 Tax=Ralstonia mannitolilytica TaxID=105219 RepID=UPI0007896118|nr:recombination protein NinB [Ralstonia mannitolilytica]
MAAAQSIVLRTERDAQRLWGVLKGWLSMADLGKPIAVEVSEYHAKRSLDQNKRLHAMLNEISQNAYLNGRRYEMEAWKEFYRSRYIGTEEIELPDGRRIERGISTTTLNKQEFADFLTAIESHAAAEFGLEFRD